MRKRRRLANKMTMMVCAVLIAVSAFFYAPMNVEASLNDVNVIVNQTVYPDLYNTGGIRFPIRNFNFVSGLDSDTFYSVSMDIDFGFSFNDFIQLRDVNVFYGDLHLFYKQTVGGINYSSKVFDDSVSVSFVCKGSQLHSKDLNIYGRMLVNPNLGVSSERLSFDFSFSNLVYTPLTGEESESYQNGYNAGYSAGETAGESNGYSSGYSDGYEAGEQNGYDSGFQAGTDSVDTQSYYDAGYNAGYDAGYLSGYDTGYDVGYDDGWQAYEDKISGWGADTSDYPVYITSSSSEFGFLNGYVYGNSQVYDEENIVLNFDINPNHIYRFDVKLGAPKMASTNNVLGSYTAVYFCAGGVDYFISPTFNYGEGVYKSIYVRGDMLSSSFSKKGVVTVVSSSVISPGIPAYYSFTDFWHDIQVYDVGPIGNMQNYIANQTDQLTGGYDNSQGNSANSDLSTGLNEFETAENSLFATATTGMKDFVFFDFESVPAMLTAITFITSIMASWFEQAGGASGVGIVLSILFSVMLVSMVLGLYRLYQSAGHRAEARERHRERMEQWKRRK